MNARSAIWFRALVARKRDAVFATVPAQISGGLCRRPPSSSPSRFRRRRGGNGFRASTTREEGLRILTSPRREASLFDYGGKLRFPAFFFVPTATGDLQRQPAGLHCRRHGSGQHSLDRRSDIRRRDAPRRGRGVLSREGLPRRRHRGRSGALRRRRRAVARVHRDRPADHRQCRDSRPQGNGRVLSQSGRAGMGHHGRRPARATRGRGHAPSRSWSRRCRWPRFSPPSAFPIS